jgi:AhpD family alkylhydroperoxidase
VLLGERRMPENYYEKDAIKKLGQLKRLKSDLFESISGFDAKVFADGSLPARVKELIAIGCAHVTRCPYCIDFHVRKAKKAGATDEEIAETVFVAVAMSAGASMAHACVTIDSLAEAEQGN